MIKRFENEKMTDTEGTLVLEYFPTKHRLVL